MSNGEADGEAEGDPPEEALLLCVSSPSNTCTTLLSPQQHCWHTDLQLCPRYCSTQYIDSFCLEVVHLLDILLVHQLPSIHNLKYSILIILGAPAPFYSQLISHQTIKHIIHRCTGTALESGGHPHRQATQSAPEQPRLSPHPPLEAPPQVLRQEHKSAGSWQSSWHAR